MNRNFQISRHPLRTFSFFDFDLRRIHDHSRPRQRKLRNPVKPVPGLFSIGYFPIANFFKDISPSDKCLPEFLPIMDFYPSCFAHQEKSLPGFIPITILPIYWWIFTHQNFAHQRIAHHTGKNQKFTKKIKISLIFQLFSCTKSILQSKFLILWNLL